MDQGRTVTKILERKLDGSRRKGRPRLRWLDDVEKDLWEMKFKNGNRKQLIGQHGHL